MVSRRNVCVFLTAPARSGKTFRVVVRICDEILPQTEGIIYTNLPLNVELIVEYCVGKYGMDADLVRTRLHILPGEVEMRWRNAGRQIFDEKSGKKIGVHPFDGPWSYFEDKPLSGSTIIIDEIHNFCGSIGTPKPVANNWQAWLGELGHNQAIFICISQSPEKVHPCIKQEAQASYVIRNTGLERDPLFGIEFYDWLEMWSGLFGGEYRVFVFEQEMQKVEGRRVKGQRSLILMGPPYFDFYDSFNKPIAGGQTENIAVFAHEYEKHLRKGFIRGRLSLIRWFVTKNFQPLVKRGGLALAAVGVMVFLANGGLGEVMRRFSDAISRKSKTETSMESNYKENGTLSSPQIFLPEAKKTMPDEDVLKKIRFMYEEELRKALVEKEMMTVELEKTETLLESAHTELSNRSALILMTPDSIVFKGGYVYEVGQEITTGGYKGNKIVGVDYKRREAVLDDGSVLGLAD